jgi:serine protease Do
VDCRSFDEQLVRRDPRVADLMDKFVCVRLVQANGADLSLFQFDYDLTFAAFFMNADKTIYGRFGTRSSRKDAMKDMSMEGFRKALEEALDLHKKYPANRASLTGKHGSPPRFAVPEDYPSLKGKYTAALDYEGKVVQSCIHCHQVRDAEFRFFRDDPGTIPDATLYAWPMPDVVGLSLDPKEKARVASVSPGSAADKAGFKVGDEMLSLEGQPLLSIADVQWVLHNGADSAMLNARVARGNRKMNLRLNLDRGWRRKTDFGWRTTTWDLRRMATGGLVLKDLTEGKQPPPSLPNTGLFVQYVGQYGEHASGKRAGFQTNDVIVSVDGRNNRMTESDLIGYLVQSKKPGDKVPFTVLRGGQQVNLEMPMQ